MNKDSVRKRMQQEHIDSIFKMAVYDMSVLELDEMRAEYESARQSGGGFKPSPGFSKRVRKTIGREFLKSAVKRALVKSVKPLKNAALILLVMGIVFFSMMFTIDAFRINVYNLLLQVEDTHTRISLGGGGGSSGSSASGGNRTEIDLSIFDGVAIEFFPTYIPRGFAAIEAIENPERIIITFVNNNRDYISFTRFLEPYVNADTENAVNFDFFMINGGEAKYFEKNGIGFLYWNMGDDVFSIMSQIDRTVIVQIAESVQKVK